MVKKSGTLLLVQVVVNQANRQIICTAFDKGRVHDFRLFKSHRIPMLPLQLCLADRGYQGLALATFEQFYSDQEASQGKVGQVRAAAQSIIGTIAGGS